MVRYCDADVYVDCATADIDPKFLRGAGFEAEAAGAAPGDSERVYALDACGESVPGRILSTNYSETLRIEGVRTLAQGQILVRSLDPGRVFNRPGDSGVALRNEVGAIVGLVWGFSASGDALACPIAPVQWVLNIELARLVSPEVS